MVTAQRLAVESDAVTADMVEATEFPQLAIRYNVRGVPKIVVNEVHHFEGALPEDAFVDKVLNVIREDDTGGEEKASE